MSEYTDYELVKGWDGDWMERYPVDHYPSVGVRFRVIEDEWDTTGDIPLRTIKKVELIDVSLTDR